MAEKKRRGVMIRCPRRWPQFVVDEDGLEVKCHTHRGEIFRISWATLEQIRADLVAGRPVLEQEGA